MHMLTIAFLHKAFILRHLWILLTNTKQTTVIGQFTCGSSYLVLIISFASCNIGPYIINCLYLVTRQGLHRFNFLS